MHARSPLQSSGPLTMHRSVLGVGGSFGFLEAALPGGGGSSSSGSSGGSSGAINGSAMNESASSYLVRRMTQAQNPGGEGGLLPFPALSPTLPPNLLPLPPSPSPPSSYSSTQVQVS